jgi:CheY-like chemotaxis protein
MLYKNCYILSADDDQDDQEFISAALKEISPESKLIKVANGAQLLDFLKESKFNGREFPDLILLDLNMPLKNGKEAISDLKAKDSEFRDIPVMILTTSASALDIEYCLNKGADSYKVKPSDFTDLVLILKNALQEHCINA